MSGNIEGGFEADQNAQNVAQNSLLEALQNGDINEEMRSLYESKFTKLFEVVMRIYEKEAVLKKRAQVLAQEKDGLEHDIRHNDDVKMENETKIHTLQEEVQKLNVDYGETKEQQITLDLQKKDMQSQIDEYKLVLAPLG
ncbi:MAG: hypothetical protein EZS28_013738 [Streblomastix strix]|uniref:Uncharacterized protein n=1 Tax=Streblomastix strix TaxID=222440 RepID=A0A5J4W7B0_9EUKA|nr:MAG: hypothetical protein EZS28_013738 [Streblomastix strix]